MEYKVLERISQEIKQNKRVALATVTKTEGSTSRKEGAMMAILSDGTTFGTIGGGKLELVVISEGKKRMIEGNSKSYNFKLNDDEGGLHMKCGGEAEIFINVFNPHDKLLIIGGGHIGLELYKFSKALGFYTGIFDTREEFCNSARFPEADELILGDIKETLQNYPLDDKCYVVIVTYGHKHDEIALKAVLDRNAKYLGLIGSKTKAKYIIETLKEQGISEESLESVYAPIGIDLNGETPAEIAFSIMAEILLIRNGGSLSHLKDTMK